MASKINIAQFSTNDVSGGAARASARLKDGFLQDDRVDVKYFVKTKIEDSLNTEILIYKNKIDIDFSNLINSKYINNNRTELTNTLFSFSYCDVKLANLDSFDIINLHWIENFLSFNNLYELTKLNKPIIWTLHDMKPFTGGCHYSSTCRAYENECRDCLQLINNKNMLAQKALHAKKEIFQNANITIVSPSVWLANEAKKSSLFKNKRIEIIPYGVDSNVFKAIDKNVAKKALGIDEGCIVLSFGVMSHAELRKGFKELFQAMQLLKNRIKNKNVIALFFGSGSETSFPLNVVNVGHVNSDEKLSYVYSATDVFILPSLEDNLPNTILESLSCETPIVAFDTGGAKDIIDDSNGKIVPKGDVKALSDEIYNLIIHQELREEKGKNGRRLILNKYQLHHQSDKYIKLFKELEEKSFNYESRYVDVNATFDDIINSAKDDILSFKFSKNFNNFYSQILELKDKNDKYIIYGNGTVGKTIIALLQPLHVEVVDMNNSDDAHHPSNLVKMKYDKIIISVLGIEEPIVDYLTSELKIDENKIVCIDI